MKRLPLQRRTTNLLRAAAIVGLVGVIGAFALHPTSAATYATTAEAETGTLSGNATSIGDPSASGGTGVKFGATASGGQTCPPFPAFPNANCTGVPPGTSLTTINGSLSTTSNGQTIDARLITGNLNVLHGNVTVTNSRIKGSIDYNNHRGLTLRDVDLGPDSCPSSGGGGLLLAGNDYTLIRTHFHHQNDDLLRLAGGSNGNILIQDSLFNETCFYAGDHLDAIQLHDPGEIARVTLVHNRVDVRPANNSNDKGNAAIFWADNPGAGSTLTMYNNIFGGGQITVAAYDATANSGVVIDIHDNHFIRNSYAIGACSLGTSVRSVPFNGTSGVKWTNNTYDDGVIIPLSSC